MVLFRWHDYASYGLYKKTQDGYTLILKFYVLKGCTDMAGKEIDMRWPLYKRVREASKNIKLVSENNESNQYIKVRYNYVDYIDTIPLNEKLVLIESQHGSEINGNIFYIIRYLATNKQYSDYKLYVSAAASKKDKFEHFLKDHKINNVSVTILSSDEYFRLLASAKYLINDNTFMPWYIKREGQIYLNTWHGTPLKCLGRKMESGFAEIGNAQKNFICADYLLYPNEYTMKHMLDDYMINNIGQGKCVLSGYPRNEVFFEHDTADSIRKKYNLEGKRVYAYMPTFRGTASEGKTLKSDSFMMYYLYKIDELLKDDEEFYVNLHPVSKSTLSGESFKHIKFFPEEYETYEFLSACDALVTDYSSVFFDYANLRRKIVLFTFDKEDYLKDRGLYLSMDELPFPEVSDVPELMNELRSDINYDDTEFVKKYCPYDGLSATEKLIKLVFDGSNECDVREIPYNGRKNVFLYAGNLARNGITQALVNLVKNADKDKANYIILARMERIKSSYEVLRTLSQYAPYYCIMGKMMMTWKERCIREYYVCHVLSTKTFIRKVGNSLDKEMVRIFGDGRADELIHFNGYEREITAQFSRFKGKKVIFVHNDMCEEIKTKKAVSADVLKYAYTNYDKVAVVTDDLMESTRSLADQKSDIVVSNNIIDYRTVFEKSAAELCFDESTEVYPSENSLKKLLASDKKKFVTIGRYSPEKGHLRLLEAYKKFSETHPDTELVIIGGVSNFDYYERTQAKISELKLEGKVVLVKNIANPFPIVKACDYFILSSFYEGFGLVLAEADILNKPVVSTDITGPRGFFKKHSGCLVESSEEGLLKGLNMLYDGKVKPMNVNYEEYNNEALEQFYSLL